MIRLFLPDDLVQGGLIALESGQSRYLATVMRLSVGDEVVVFNGRDGEWRATLETVGKRGVSLALHAVIRTQSTGPDLDLIAALVKRARLETIVEKATELGAARVRLAITTRTNADHTNVARLQAIATEAAEQTGRLDVPEIQPPARLDRLLADWPAGRRLMFCDEAGDCAPALDALRGAPAGPWAVLIGPEGGFAPAERDLLLSLDYAVPVSLGPRILRADTAAAAALTLWQAVLGDWAGG